MEWIQSQSTEPLYPSRDHIVKQKDPIRIQPKKEDNNFSTLNSNSTNSKDKFCGKDVRAQEKVDKEDIESGNAYPDGPF